MPDNLQESTGFVSVVESASMSKPGKHVKVTIAILAMVAFCLAFAAHIPHSHLRHKHFKTVANVVDAAVLNLPAALTTTVCTLPKPARIRAIPQYGESVAPVRAGEYESPTTRPPPLLEFPEFAQHS